MTHTNTTHDDATTQIDHYDSESGALLVSFTRAAALQCSSSGSVDDAVAFHVQQSSTIFHADDQTLRTSLRATGAWDDLDDVDSDTIKQRVLWIAACDARERALDSETFTQIADALRALSINLDEIAPTHVTIPDDQFCDSNDEHWIWNVTRNVRDACALNVDLLRFDDDNTSAAESFTVDMLGASPDDVAEKIVDGIHAFYGLAAAASRRLCDCNACEIKRRRDAAQHSDDDAEQTIKTRSEQLADAFVSVARADHYMIGIVDDFSDDELSDAEQIVIARSNAADNADAVLELALDVIEATKRARTNKRAALDVSKLVADLRVDTNAFHVADALTTIEQAITRARDDDDTIDALNDASNEVQRLRDLLKI